MNTLKLDYKLRCDLRRQGRAELKRAGLPEEISPLEELEDFLERVDPLNFSIDPGPMDEREDLLWRLKIARVALDNWFKHEIAALEANCST